MRTTSRCQTVIVATGIPVPHVDFGSRALIPGAKNGGVANVIQSVAFAGQTTEYWRPASLVGAASGPWAGTRLEVGNGGSNPAVEVQTGERVATGIFVGGVDTSAVENLVLSVQIQPSTNQQLVAIVAANGSAAATTSDPTTSFSYSMSGNIVTIYGVPQDGLGGYQDIWIITQVIGSNGNLTTTASIAGSLETKNGKLVVRSLGNTSNDTSQSTIISGVTGLQPGALRVDDVPDNGSVVNPF